MLDCAELPSLDNLISYSELRCRVIVLEGKEERDWEPNHLFLNPWSFVKMGGKVVTDT